MRKTTGGRREETITYMEGLYVSVLKAKLTLLSIRFVNSDCSHIALSTCAFV